MGGEISKIVIHCSDSEFGNAGEIRRWHLRRGWRDIGYHYVINNGYPSPHFYLPATDGCIEIGRPLNGDRVMDDDEVGAHAYGLNGFSVGVCLIGRDKFSSAQLKSLITLTCDLITRLGLSPDDVIGHYETKNADGKTCPNFPVVHLRSVLRLNKYFVR